MKFYQQYLNDKRSASDQTKVGALLDIEDDYKALEREVEKIAERVFEKIASAYGPDAKFVSVAVNGDSTTVWYDGADDDNGPALTSIPTRLLWADDAELEAYAAKEREQQAFWAERKAQRKMKKGKVKL